MFILIRIFTNSCTFFNLFYKFKYEIFAHKSFKTKVSGTDDFILSFTSKKLHYAFFFTTLYTLYYLYIKLNETRALYAHTPFNSSIYYISFHLYTSIHLILCNIVKISFKLLFFSNYVIILLIYNLIVY